MNKNETHMNNMHIYIRTVQFQHVQIGTLILYSTDIVSKVFQTLEQGWEENRPFLSCIPSGWYRGTVNRLERHIEIENLPRRDSVRLDRFGVDNGNILVGRKIKIDDSGVNITTSHKVMKELISEIPPTTDKKDDWIPIIISRLGA